MQSERDALLPPAQTRPQQDPRVGTISWMLRVGTLLGLAIVIGRVIQLQVAPGDKLSEFVQSRTTSHAINSTRGDLLDRRGRVIATTRIGYRVIVDPVVLQNAIDADPTAFDRLIVDLGSVLETPADRFAQRMISRLVQNQNTRLAMEHQQPVESASQNTGGLAQPATLASPGASGPAGGSLRLSRYLRIGETLTQDQTQRLRELKSEGRLPGVSLEHESVREQTASDLVGSIVGKVAFAGDATEKTGVMGAEKLFDQRLTGHDGSLTYVRDDLGRPLWIERGDWINAEQGRDVRLSIDLEIQRIVRDQLQWGVEQADAAGGRAIVINPHSGEILAMTDVLREIPDLAEVQWWDPESGEPRPQMPPKDEQPRYRVLNADDNRSIDPALGHNRCLEDVYEPGSTFKPFAWTLAKSRGLLPDDEVLDIKQKAIRTHYNRRIEDVYTHSDLDNWDAVIRYSSNIGMYMATSRLSFDELRGMVLSLGFGQPTGIGLAGEASGLVTSAERWSNYSQTSVGMGYEVGVTPIQMARAFSVFARRGELAGTLPEIRLTAVGDTDKPGMIDQETIVHRVFSADAARRTIRPMTSVAEKMDQTMQRQYPDLPKPRYSMFGKSGTSQIAMVPFKPGLRIPGGTRGYYEKQHHSSFIVAAPADDPQIVVLVVIDDIGPERVSKQHHYGSWVAGPVVRRIVEDVLPYLNVPPASDPEGAE